AQPVLPPRAGRAVRRRLRLGAGNTPPAPARPRGAVGLRADAGGGRRRRREVGGALPRVPRSRERSRGAGGGVQRRLPVCPLRPGREPDRPLHRRPHVPPLRLHGAADAHAPPPHPPDEPGVVPRSAGTRSRGRSVMSIKGERKRSAKTAERSVTPIRRPRLARPRNSEKSRVANPAETTAAVRNM